MARDELAHLRKDHVAPATTRENAVVADAAGEEMLAARGRNVQAQGVRRLGLAIAGNVVELGLGVGILAKMAFDEKRDRMLRAIDAGHLFESSTTRLGIKRGAYLRRYAYEFIELFAPQLPRGVVERAVVGQEGSRYEL